MHMMHFLPFAQLNFCTNFHKTQTNRYLNKGDSKNKAALKWIIHTNKKPEETKQEGKTRARFQTIKWNTRKKSGLLYSEREISIACTRPKPGFHSSSSIFFFHSGSNSDSYFACILVFISIGAYVNTKTHLVMFLNESKRQNGTKDWLPSTGWMGKSKKHRN